MSVIGRFSRQIWDLGRVPDGCDIPQNLPTNFHSDLTATIQQRCLPLLCALLFQQSHVCLICVVQTIVSGKIFTGFPEFQGIVQCKWLLVSSRVPGTFASFSVFPEKFFDLHGYDWIHWVNKSCTTIVRFTIFTENFVICCCQVTKNFCTRHGSAIAPSSDRSRNFGLWGNEYKHCALPKSSRLLDVDSKDTSWEEMTCESLCSGTSSSSKCSLNSCSHSGISELARPESTNNGFSPFHHQHWKLDTSTGEESISLWSSLSRVPLSLDFAVVGEEDELEEDARWLPLLSWRCHWSWRMRTGGRTRWQTRNHYRNEVLRLALCPNPVFDEMWFLSVDPLMRASVFIGKLSERCWRILQECIQFFDIHCWLFMRLHSCIGGYDCRRTSPMSSKYPFQLHSGPFWWSCASTLRSPQQTLVPQV